MNGVDFIPEQLLMARDGLGLTQEVVAQRAQLSTNALSRIELGKSSPRASTLQRIVNVLRMAGATFEHRVVDGESRYGVFVPERKSRQSGHGEPPKTKRPPRRAAKRTQTNEQ